VIELDGIVVGEGGDGNLARLVGAEGEMEVHVGAVVEGFDFDTNAQGLGAVVEAHDLAAGRVGPEPLARDAAVELTGLEFRKAAPLPAGGGRLDGDVVDYPIVGVAEVRRVDAEQPARAAQRV
jgi:hypothetical protein